MSEHRRIYLASSWRNDFQPEVLAGLRAAGHEVYDFRNPWAGIARNGSRGVGTGFQWSEIDPDWQRWTVTEYRRALEHPIAVKGFQSDFDAMEWADTGVLLLPSGRSAHLEAGYFVGAGKLLHILMLIPQEPELMYRMATKVSLSLNGLLESLALPALAAHP